MVFVTFLSPAVRLLSDSKNVSCTTLPSLYPDRFHGCSRVLFD